MRNILEHVKGKLFALASRGHGDKVSWTAALERLRTTPIADPERDILLTQEQTGNDLHKKLTGMAKNATAMDVKVTAIQVLTHLFTVLSLFGL